MRAASALNSIWERGGPFIGDDRAHGRVTVEPDWWLNIHATGPNKKRKGPIRCFQDPDRVEVEVPNIKSIAVDRSLDSDAATATIVLYNQWHEGNLIGGSRELGYPGYFTANRGLSADARARWGHTENEWSGVLVENALLRTYEGYGGHGLAIEDALADGFLLQTGLWFVDEIRVRSDGMIEMKCRDAAKLLVDQQLFPPLVPAAEYPLRYYRWAYTTWKAVPGYNAIEPPFRQALKRCVPIAASSTDLGHAIAKTVDGKTDTFWLSSGVEFGDEDLHYATLEYSCGETIDAIYIHAFNGDYQIHVSIWERGAWATSGTSVGGGNTIDGIPFIMRNGVPYEAGHWYTLQRRYDAEKVRITLTAPSPTQWGPGYYRFGLREVKFGLTEDKGVAAATGKFVGDIALTPTGQGYWLVGSDGGVFSYGDAKFQGSRAGQPMNKPMAGIAADPYGGGYWLVGEDGGVFTYGEGMLFLGSHPQYPDPLPSPVIDIEATANGGGYWLVTRQGEVYAFGNAGYHGGNPTTGGFGIVDIAPTADGGGYWMLDENGKVYAFGNATHHGDRTADPNNDYIAMAARPQGDGYWLVRAGSGDVYAFGAAQVLPENGNMPNAAAGLNDSIFDIDATPTGEGYVLVGGDGGVFSFGDAPWEGSMPGDFTKRRDGNYLDYVDIIKELLLWSGFWLCGLIIDGIPQVFGNLESTGAYSEEELPPEMFDKQPVINAINAIKEIVGYIFYIDPEGGAHFESPNWWASGNFWLDSGQHTTYTPEIDERLTLIDYAVVGTDRPARSELVVSTDDPAHGFESTVTSRFVPPTAGVLRGMCKPMMWVNQWFSSKDEQKVMAELVALHIWFQQRLGSVTAAANPCIGINDQVRIFERQTGETFVHYVRGVSTQHDLDTGEYKMTLTTHWLGDDTDWASDRISLSERTRLQLIESGSAAYGVSIGEPVTVTR